MSDLIKRIKRPNRGEMDLVLDDELDEYDRIAINVDVDGEVWVRGIEE